MSLSLLYFSLSLKSYIQDYLACKQIEYFDCLLETRSFVSEIKQILEMSHDNDALRLFAGNISD